MQEKRDRREEEGTEERCQMMRRRERNRDERGVGKKEAEKR